MRKFSRDRELALQLASTTEANSLAMPNSDVRTEELARALRGNSGWQKLVKRGVHTLRKPEYQLCYVDPGIAYGNELEQLKILDSEAFEY